NRARVQHGLDGIAARARTLSLGRRSASAAGAAIGRGAGLVQAFTVAVAIGVTAALICFEVGCCSADTNGRPGDVRADPRRYRDRGKPPLDVNVDVGAKTLRLNRGTTDQRKRHYRGQRQRRSPRLHPPTHTIVDHGTSDSCGKRIWKNVTLRVFTASP